MSSRGALASLLALALLAGCGVRGDPTAPADAVPQIANNGVQLLPDKGGLP